MGNADDPLRFAPAILEFARRYVGSETEATIHTPFSAFGMDSLDLIELAMDVEERFELDGLEIEEPTETPASVSAMIHQKKAKK